MYMKAQQIIKNSLMDMEKYIFRMDLYLQAYFKMELQRAQAISYFQMDHTMMEI